MKIGIVRHFKVNYVPKKFMNSTDFINFTNDYDNAKIIKNNVDLKNIKWNKCYCSDLERALSTATNIYNSELEITPLLREVKMYPFKITNLKIPTFLWSISSRISWKFNADSQLEGIVLTKKRAKEFLEILNLNNHNNENILIVSHGFFLITLIQELKLLGFKGTAPKRMKNGYIYIFEL